MIKAIINVSFVILMAVMVLMQLVLLRNMVLAFSSPSGSLIGADKSIYHFQRETDVIVGWQVGCSVWKARGCESDDIYFKIKGYDSDGDDVDDTMADMCIARGYNADECIQECCGKHF